jgi:hypothetical protein
MQAIQGLLDALPTHELANVQSYLDTKVSRMGLARRRRQTDCLQVDLTLFIVSEFWEIMCLTEGVPAKRDSGEALYGRAPYGNGKSML